MLQRPNLRLATVLGVTTAVGLSIYVMTLMLEYRNEGLAAIFRPKDPAEETERPERTHFHVDDNFLRLAQMIHFIPASHPHVGWQYPYYVIVRPIPRALWPTKPIGYGFNLAQQVGAEGVGLTQSVVGELYMAFGCIGILVGGWLYGRLGGMVNSLLTHTTGTGRFVLYSAAVMALFSGGRSMVEMFLMSYVLLAWMGLVWVYQFFQPVAVIDSYHKRKQRQSRGAAVFQPPGAPVAGKPPLREIVTR
jgi:hypothetical protein